MNRREMMGGLGAGMALAGAPRAGQARPRPADRTTIACIGVGSQGLRVLIDLLRLPEVQIVAVCDVNRGSSDYLEWWDNELRDKVRLLLGDPGWTGGPGPSAGRDVAARIVDAFYGHAAGRGCRAYADYRQLLAREHDLDGVVVSTPDHWHAPIAIAAMRAGRHVYGQKPMAHSIWEAREMVRVARETRRATQVSIFNAATPANARISSAIRGGLIGRVERVDMWTKRAAVMWPQGLATPTAAEPVPDGLDWDMWQGPAPARPFNRAFYHFRWRAWYDFGCGALGDMGEYGFDPVSRALGSRTASRIEASSTGAMPDCFPLASIVRFGFAAGPDIHWYDGGLEPARPPELPAGVPLGDGGEGVMYVGSAGRLVTGFFGADPRIIGADGTVRPLTDPPPAKAPPFDPDRPQLGAGAVGADAAHYREWVAACRGGPMPTANFADQLPAVETLLLGCIAQRTGEALRWDAAAGDFTVGSARAKAMVKPAMRAPYALS